MPRAGLRSAGTAPTTPAPTEEQVYKHAAAQPQQTRFPARRKIVSSKKTTKKVTYAGRRSLPARLDREETTIRREQERQRDLRQSTLSQFVRPLDNFGDDNGEDEDALYRIPSSSDHEEAAAPSSVRRLGIKAGQRTLRGHETGRKRRRVTIAAEVPSSTAGSGGTTFHTQTLTQFLGRRGGDGVSDEDGDERHDDDGVDDGLADADLTDFDFDATITAAVSPQRVDEQVKNRSPSIVPQTPQKQISARKEIPSSQPSPFTPDFNSTPGMRRLLRYTPTVQSPLHIRSTNPDNGDELVVNKSQASMHKKRKLVIQDSYSTVNGGPLSSSSQSQAHRSPLRELAVDQEGVVEVPFDLEERRNRTPQRTQSKGGHGKGKRPPLGRHSSNQENEILDSEDDEPGTPTPIRRAGGSIASSPPISRPVTQASPAASSRRTPLQQVLSRPTTPVLEDDHNVIEPETPSPTARFRTVSVESRSSHVITIDEQQDTPPSSAPLPKTPAAMAPPPIPQSVRRGGGAGQAVTFSQRSTQSQTQTQVHTQRGTPGDGGGGGGGRTQLLYDQPQTQLRTPGKTQRGQQTQTQYCGGSSSGGSSYHFGESQRVPLDVIRTMPAQTDRSDVILSVSPDTAHAIVSGKQSYDFRDFKLPRMVIRIWMYVSDPICELRYMASIGVAQTPNEIANHHDNDTDNEESLVAFKQGNEFGYAYELQQVYRINNFVPLAVMRENGWMEEPPTKYVYVPPAVLGELMGNLRCELFPSRGRDDDDEHDDEQKQVHEEQENDVQAQVEPEIPPSQQHSRRKTHRLLQKQKQQQHPASSAATTTTAAGMSVSQELEKQISNDIIHMTQFPLDTCVLQSELSREESKEREEQEQEQEQEPEIITIPSSQTQSTTQLLLPPSRTGSFPAAPPPASPLLSQLPAQLSQRGYGYHSPVKSGVRPSQATTASQPSSHSQGPRHRSPLRQTSFEESIPESPHGRPITSARRGHHHHPLLLHDVHPDSLSSFPQRPGSYSGLDSLDDLGDEGESFRPRRPIRPDLDRDHTLPSSPPVGSSSVLRPDDPLLLAGIDGIDDDDEEEDDVVQGSGPSAKRLLPTVIWDSDDGE